MIQRTILFGLGVAAALAASLVLGDDPTSRLLLERAQRADAFTLEVQHSMERGRAGALGPQEQLDLEARQRDQRRQQDELFYRQRIQTYAPQSDRVRRADAMRAEQERREQLSRFRFEALSTPGSEPPVPASPVSATIVNAPVPRVPAGPAVLPGAAPDQPEALVKIRRVEYEADTLWRTALAGDWEAVQVALGELRSSVEALRSARFKAAYAASGGREDALAAVLDRLDSALSGAEIQIGARDSGAVMRSANELWLTAAELVPEIVRSAPGQPITGR